MRMGLPCYRSSSVLLRTFSSGETPVESALVIKDGPCLGTWGAAEWAVPVVCYRRGKGRVPRNIKKFFDLIARGRIGHGGLYAEKKVQSFTWSRHGVRSGLIYSSFSQA